MIAALFMLINCAMQADPAVELGKLRAAFGTPKEPAAVRRMPHMTMYMRTDLYPEGRADVRYTLDDSADPEIRYLTKYTKANGVARVEWSIELKAAKAPRPSAEQRAKLGTLEAWLLGDGLQPTRELGPAQKASFGAQKRFAAYRTGTMFESVAYYCVELDGDHANPGNEHSFPKPRSWPAMKEPYKIPAEEAARLRINGS